MDAVRAAVQALLDADGEGWQVSQWVAAIGIERVHPEGWVEGTCWWLSPPGQAEWMTSGLLDSVVELRSTAEPAE